jgi:hypothetical protein
MNTQTLKWLAAAVLSAAFLASIAAAAQPTVTQRIEPSTIDMGEAARLTISASGDQAPAITPPMVAGLEFVAINQSQRLESINGVTHSTTSVTYQVLPRQAGVFTIPGAVAGSQPLVLTVNPGAGRGAASPGGSARPGSPQGLSGSSSGATQLASNGSAFVRLRLSKRDLYVGEIIPVDIQVGTRDGVVASLNGLPTLNGDAFTLNPLSAQPQRTEEIVDGKPFTVFTWHSALAAVKPGELSLTIEMPLTVRMRTAVRPDIGAFGDSGLDDLLNDPMFQNFFGASTEKEITVASAPTTFAVMALPARDRPANFSGAVGHFTVSTDLSDDKGAAGDPITLRLHVSGTGNFDRVSTPMLHDVDNWKTYAATAKFKPEDGIGYRGEKTFEQPLIALQAGTQSLPPLTFSWFDPSTHRYEVAHTSPLSVAITPATSGASLAQAPQAPPSTAEVVAARRADGDGLRPDHVDDGRRMTSLTPHYYQPEYLALPSLFAVAFSGVWFWQRRREHAAADSTGATGSPLEIQALLRQMDEASKSGDPALFFRSARAVLQRTLAPKWHVAPETIRVEDVDARLGSRSIIARVFKLADESAYSGAKLRAIDYQLWKHLVLGQVNNEAIS